MVMQNKVGSGFKNSEFRKIYRKEIAPILGEYEGYRKKEAQ